METYEILTPSWGLNLALWKESLSHWTAGDWGLSSLSHEGWKELWPLISGLDGDLLSQGHLPLFSAPSCLTLPARVLVSRAVTNCSEVRRSISVLLDTGSWVSVCVFMGFGKWKRERFPLYSHFLYTLFSPFPHWACSSLFPHDRALLQGGAEAEVLLVNPCDLERPNWPETGNFRQRQCLCSKEWAMGPSLVVQMVKNLSASAEDGHGCSQLVGRSCMPPKPLTVSLIQKPLRVL